MTPARLPFGRTPRASAARAAASAPPPTRPVLTVTQLTERIRRDLETAFPQVWVEGEVSNCRHWTSGHVYFTLKDDHAQISGVLFRSAAFRIRFALTDGLRVVARGRVGAYTPRSEYQLVADHLEPAGVGARQVAFEQLRARLAAEGLFDDARKRPLPMLPRRIGVVTSLDAAALRDVLTVLGRRFPNVRVVIAPSRVQGEGAAASLTAALGRVARLPEVDVVILTRGGGSVEDLWAFNDEALARAIAAAPVPVISAVGHQTDFTISDFVADLRAATPSAAAERVVAPRADLDANRARLAHRLRAAAREAIARRRMRLDQARHRPGLAAYDTRIAQRSRLVDELTHRLLTRMRADLARQARRRDTLRARLDAVAVAPRLARGRTRLTVAHERLGRTIADARALGAQRLAAARERLAPAARARALETRRRLTAARERLARGADRRTTAARQRLATLAAQLQSLDPLAVLARGFAVCRRDGGDPAIVRRAADVAIGDAVRITLHEGELRCAVTARRDDTPQENRHDG